MKETKEILVSFVAEINADFEEEFKQIIVHKMDALIDMDSYPEIKNIHTGLYLGHVTIPRRD